MHKGGDMEEEKVRETLRAERQKYEQMRQNLNDLLAKIDELEAQRAFTAGRISALEDMIGAWGEGMEEQEQTETVTYRAPFSRQ